MTNSFNWILQAASITAVNLGTLPARKGSTAEAIFGIAGVVAAFASSRLLSSLLVGITPYDATTFSVAWFLMTTVALFASAIPASQAAHTDPISVLRSE